MQKVQTLNFSLFCDDRLCAADLFLPLVLGNRVAHKRPYGLEHVTLRHPAPSEVVQSEKNRKMEPKTFFFLFLSENTESNGTFTTTMLACTRTS